MGAAALEEEEEGEEVEESALAKTLPTRRRLASTSLSVVVYMALHVVWAPASRVVEEQEMGPMFFQVLTICRPVTLAEP